MAIERRGDQRPFHAADQLLAEVPPRVAIVVLNWNRCRDTLECLESLSALDYPNAEVVVVDNASTDGSPAAVRDRFQRVTLLENTANLGYAEGNNVGLRYALKGAADYVLLLNNDTVVHPRFLTALLRVALADRDAGVLGPTICYYDRPDVIWSAGGEIDWRTGRTRMTGLDEVDRGQYAEPREVQFVTGCALLVGSMAVRRAGLLDPRFFSYYEEVEYCSRIRRAGFRVWQVPAAKVWHKISPPTQLVSPRVVYYMTRNRLLFLRLSGAGSRAQLRCIAGQVRAVVSWSLRRRHRHRRGQRGAVVRGIVDFARGHFGEAGV